MKRRSTSYPAIALLISLIILVSGFALATYGINNFLEEKRKYGNDMLTDFRNYNIFQMYAYVLSDYEVRRIFFKTFYEEIINKSITNGILNASLYNTYLLSNPKISQYYSKCENIFDVVVDEFLIPTIFGNYIYMPIIIYLPCFELIPISNFSVELNQSFINKLKQNYLSEDIFKKHADTLSKEFNFTLLISSTDFNISRDDIIFRQDLKYVYKGKTDTFSRYFELSINYSLIPNILLYINHFKKDYSNFLNDLLNNLRDGNSKLYENISQIVSQMDGNKRVIGNIYSFNVLYKNRTKEFTILNLLKKLYNLSNTVSSPLYQNYQEIYLCEQIEVYSNSTYPLTKEVIRGCSITKTPDELKRDTKYQYLIETCLNDQYYANSDFVNVTLAYICYYHLYLFDKFYDLDRNLNFPQVMIPPFYGSNNTIDPELSKLKDYYNSISEGFYLWPTEEIPSYRLKIAGIYVPIKCILGYNYEEGPYFFLNYLDCLDNRTNLTQSYGKRRDPTLFVSDCENITIPLPPPLQPIIVHRVYVGRYVRKMEGGTFFTPLQCGQDMLYPMLFGVYIL